MDDDEALHGLIADACLGARTQEELEEKLAELLKRHEVAARDAEAILASPPRLALYRRLVRNNLTGVTEKLLARTRGRLEAIAPGEWDATFDAFLDEVGPRTHYLRDVPSELLAWAIPRWRRDARIPAWLPELASFELLEFTVGTTPDEPLPKVTDVALDRPLVFTHAIRFVRFDHAVHALPEGEADRTEPAARETALLVYRAADHATHVLALTPLAASIVERLLASEPPASALPPACREHGVALDANALGEIARLLADLAERGVLLGGRCT